MYIHTHSDRVDLLNSDIFAFFQFVFEHLQFHFNMFMFLGDPLSLEYYTINRKRQTLCRIIDAHSSIPCFVFKVFFFLISSSS